MTQINIAGQKYTDAANNIKDGSYQLYHELKKHILDNEHLIGLQMVEIEKLKKDVVALQQLNKLEEI